MFPQEQFTGVAEAIVDAERRRSPRFSVQLGVHIRDANGTMMLNVTSAWTLDLSTSGVKLEWPLCDECPPRQARPDPAAYSGDMDAIDPLCCLKVFDSRLCGGRELSFCFEFPQDRTVRAHGKVAYVRLDPYAPVDQVGIEFTSIEGNGREVIADVLRGVKKVLVVDNASGLVNELTMRVSSIGYAAICAADCEEAARIIMADAPDLVVAGVAMPEMEGPYIINRLHDAAPALPVILVSPEGAQRPENDLDCFAMLCEPYAPVKLETAIDLAVGLDNDESGDYVKA